MHKCPQCSMNLPTRCSQRMHSRTACELRQAQDKIKKMDPRWEEYCREFMKGCSIAGAEAVRMKIESIDRPQDCPECVDAFVGAIQNLRKEKDGE